jgi:transcriptional regulator NrdR family protein
MSRCPDCGGKARVLETRESKIGTRRRRQCGTCGQRFTTYELAIVALVARRVRQSQEASGRDETPDPTEIASEVVYQLEDRFEQLQEIPGEVVEALLAEAEAIRAEPPALPPGDDD